MVLVEHEVLLVHVLQKVDVLVRVVLGHHVVGELEESGVEALHVLFEVVHLREELIR